MLIDNFDVTVEQVGPGVWRIQVVTPDKNTFRAQIQCNGLNEEIAYHQIWNGPDKNIRKQFFLDLESVIIKDAKEKESCK